MFEKILNNLENNSRGNLESGRKKESAKDNFPGSREEIINQEPKIQVEDRRNPETAYGFNLNEFLEDMKIFLMEPREFDKFTDNNKDFSEKYGGLSKLHRAESEEFRELLRNSLATKIVVEDIAKRINGNLLKRTLVHIYMLENEDRGEAMTLYFDENGNYVSHGNVIKTRDNGLKQVSASKEVDSTEMSKRKD